MPTDLLLLSNGPGEITTWVRPVVKALRQKLGNDRSQIRISLILSPCPNASGKEVEIAQSYPEIDRVQDAKHFFPFLLWGKTADHWDWHDRGVVLFLGGDQVFPVIIGKRLGYKTVIYGEWDTRWHGWIDRFGVMKSELIDRMPPKYRSKAAVVGDLMGEAGAVGRAGEQGSRGQGRSPLIGLLPGSKAAKLAQGVPLTVAIAEEIQTVLPEAKFVVPVAPTLDIRTLAKFGDPAQNPVSQYFRSGTVHLKQSGDASYLDNDRGLKIALRTDFPAYELLAQCDLCLTTVGANTAELGSLAVPMIVMIPTQQLDAMRAWDGIPGLLVNLPGVGTAMAKLINGWFLRKKRLLAWPNIWAGEEIVPERVGNLQPQTIAQEALDLLTHPEKLAKISDRLRQARGEAGAADRLAAIVCEEVNE